MSANEENHDNNRDHRHFAVAPVPPDADVFLGRIAIALERIADCLAAGCGPTSAGRSADDELLDIGGVAARLGVSTRWVQRHLRPSFRATARGKAWFRLGDIEQQLASCAPIEVDRVPRRPKKRVSDRSTMQRTQPEEEIAEVERRLRASMAKPTRRSR